MKAAEQHATILRTTILPQVRQTLDASRIAYQTNRSDFLAMLDNERMLLEAQLEYARALSAFDEAIAELESALGIDLAPDMLVPARRTIGGDR